MRCLLSPVFHAFHSFRFPATSPFEFCVSPFVQNSLDHTVPRSLYTIRLRVSSSIYSVSLASRRFLFAYHLSFVPGCQSHISFLFSSIYRRSNPSPLSLSLIHISSYPYIIVPKAVIWMRLKNSR